MYRCRSMVRASHWSAKCDRWYTYVTFALPSESMQLNGQSISLVIRRLHAGCIHMEPLLYHLSPCSSMVRVSYWSSEGYRLYTYVTFALSSQSMQLNGQSISLVIRRLQVVHIYFILTLGFVNLTKLSVFNITTSLFNFA